MKKYLLLLLGAALMSSCTIKIGNSSSSDDEKTITIGENTTIQVDGTTVKLSGKTSEKKHPVSSFTSLVVSSAIDVEFCDNISEIIVTTDDSLHRYLQIKQEGKTLSIGYPNRINISGNVTTHVKVPTQAHLSQLDVSGSSSVTGAINGKELEVIASGASDITLTGAVVNLNVDISGSSSLNSGDGQLKVTNLTGELSGASSIVVDCNGSIACDLSGASTINYTGNADTSQSECSGASSINQEIK